MPANIQIEIAIDCFDFFFALAASNYYDYKKNSEIDDYLLFRLKEQYDNESNEK
jgi:hypothetical protein